MRGRRLAAFQKSYPQSYRPEIERALDDIRGEFSAGDCACAGKDSVTHEFELFLKAHPEDSMAPTVRQRLEDVRQDRLPFRYQCRPG